MTPGAASKQAPNSAINLADCASFEQVFYDRDGNEVLALSFRREADDLPQVTIKREGLSLTIFDIDA